MNKYFENIENIITDIGNNKDTEKIENISNKIKVNYNKLINFIMDNVEIEAREYIKNNIDKNYNDINELNLILSSMYYKRGYNDALSKSQKKGRSN